MKAVKSPSGVNLKWRSTSLKPPGNSLIRGGLLLQTHGLPAIQTDYIGATLVDPETS
jgi:hypothetical protein